MIHLIFLLTGSIVGFLSGIFGIGGGILIFPVIYFCLNRINHIPQDLSLSIAAATALMITIPTLSATIITREGEHEIRWRTIFRLLPGILFGVFIATIWLTHKFNPHVIKVIFTITSFLIALQFYFNYVPARKIKKTPGYLQAVLVGAIIGTFSSLLGITGGEYTSSFLRYHRIKIKHVAATTAVIGLIISISGSLGFLVSFFTVKTHNVPHTIGYIFWPALLQIGLTSLFMAFIGERFSHHFKSRVLCKILAIVIIITGILMLTL